MAIKKLCQVGLLNISLFMMAIVAAQDNPFGQSFQINTYLKSFIGKPSWILIVRDEESGQVLPYLFDFTQLNNFWVGFTFAHSYRVIVSDLQFGPPDCIIHNFCHLQDGILDRESLAITLQGDLTPDRHTSRCHVMRYKNLNFPIANTSASDSNNTTNTTAQTENANRSESLTNALSGGSLGSVSENISNLISKNTGTQPP